MENDPYTITSETKYIHNENNYFIGNIEEKFGTVRFVGSIRHPMPEEDKLCVYEKCLTPYDVYTSKITDDTYMAMCDARKSKKSDSSSHSDTKPIDFTVPSWHINGTISRYYTDGISDFESMYKHAVELFCRATHDDRMELRSSSDPDRFHIIMSTTPDIKNNSYYYSSWFTHVRPYTEALEIMENKSVKSCVVGMQHCNTKGKTITQMIFRR
jgi:hypothetical protein